MTSAPPPRRLSCTICLRPQSACVCQWITPVLHRVEVLILQHPLEVGNAKGSARLLRLIVLDGTWRKSRKMLYLNPLLQHLPRLSLQGMPASNYRIRKAHKPDQLSTLQATCAALMQLERRVEPFQPLLRAFDGFVEQ